MTIRRSQFLGSSLAFTLASGEAAFAQAGLIPVKVGATPNDTYSQAYYAADAGFFARAGLDAQVQTLNNGAAVSAAVASGALDVGVSTPVQLAAAYAHGVPFTMIAAGALDTPKAPAGMVLVQKNGPIRTAKDLEGKTVALNALKTLSEMAFDLWMQRAGGDPSTVRTVEMTFSSMGPAVERGTVAAAVSAEPALSVSLANNNVRSLGDPYSAIAPQILISGWFTTTAWVQKNPEAAKRTAAALAAAGAWANTHQDDSAVILAKYTKMDLNIVRGMARAPFAGTLRITDIQPELDVSTKFGLLPRAVSAVTLISHLG
jgi:NitT/TauT family transport system substrate-binding protein